MTKGARGGFTLVEVMLAGAIAVLLTLSLMEGLIVSTKISHENAELLAADAFAWDTAWRWLNKSYDDLPSQVAGVVYDSETDSAMARTLAGCPELDADKTEKARYLRQLKEKMEEIAEAEYIAKSEAAIAKFKDKQQEAMNAEIDAALGMQLAGDGTNEEAAKDASENEDDEAKEEPVDDSPLDETAQPDGFMDITSETFMEGQDDFEVDF